jgi:CubicO group peptidase (beta-lactamase class C family)
MTNFEKHSVLVAIALLLPMQPLFAADARIRAAETGLRDAVEVQGGVQERWTIADRMKHWGVPGVSVAVIRDGKVAWAKGYGLKQAGTTDKIDTDTVFSVGSVSKVGAASVTLRLVDAGQLDLDRDVNEYLTRWKIPPNSFSSARPVTLRGILSHTAGLNVHGFPDFKPDAPVPTILETLQGKAPAVTEPVQVTHLPGTKLVYSGGGTTIEQLIIEERTGLDFPAAARRHVFDPLGMKRSTYQNPLPASHGNIAKAHDRDGKPTALPRGWETMPELAASGLWTTPSDYAKLMIALMDSYQGDANSFLTQELAVQMMTEVGPSRAGLGPFLDGQGLSRRFAHSGSNDSYKAYIEGYPAKGDGLVIFTNGRRGFRVINELRRAIAIAEGWPFTGVTAVPAVTLSVPQLAELTGLYMVAPAGGVVNTRHGVAAEAAYKVSADGTRLRISDASGVGQIELTAEDRTHFVADEDADVRVEFVRGYDGGIERLIHRYGEYAVEAVKQK